MELGEKIIASLLEPIFIITIFQINELGSFVAIIWFISNLFVLFNDKETLIIEIIKIFLGLN